jgi:VCBS repeat-containing protein
VAVPVFDDGPGEGTEVLPFTLVDGELYEVDPNASEVAVTIEDGIIEPANQAPVAVNDAATLDLDRGESITINVLDNDSDPDADSLSIASFDTAGTFGEVTQDNGTLTYNAKGFFAYLAAGETATDTFGYTITDGDLTDTAEVTVTLEGPDDVFNSGTEFSFRQGTNGGANRFGFNGDAFFISGQGVRGRFNAQDFDPFLVKAAEVFDGVIEATGTINDQFLPQGQGPNILEVNDENEVIIGGRNTSGNYRIQFENTQEAETFKSFVDRILDEIDKNDAVANDPTDFRFDALTGEARIFYDDVNGEFGFTIDMGATQQRFDELELFVEGLATDLFGGTQIRDGRFNAERIADGRIPNIVRVIRDDKVLIGGRSVGGRFQFDFSDSTTAELFVDTTRTLFDNIGETGALAVGDR